MKEIDIREAFRLTSPNPLILVCTEKEDGSLNMAPVSFFMFTSFTPPMVAFAMGEKKNSGDHILYSCRVDRILGDPDTEALLARKGYAEVETAHKG